MKRILIAAFVAGLLLPPAAPAQENAATLTVAGHGEVGAEPDIARLVLGVEEFAPDAQQAMAKASASARAILDALAAAGVAGRDVQTGEISLQPRYLRGREPEEMQLLGFEARNMLRVRLRDMEAVGAVLDAVLAAGANSFRGLRFDVLDPEPLADEARRRAVADAMRRAAVLAEAAGVRLGPVVSITETSGGPPVAMETMRAAAPGAPVAPGEVTVSASVTMVFALGGN